MSPGVNHQPVLPQPRNGSIHFPFSFFLSQNFATRNYRTFISQVWEKCNIFKCSSSNAPERFGTKNAKKSSRNQKRENDLVNFENACHEWKAKNEEEWGKSLTETSAVICSPGTTKKAALYRHFSQIHLFWVWLIWLYSSSIQTALRATIVESFFWSFVDWKNTKIMPLPGLKIERVINGLVKGFFMLLYWSYTLAYTVYVSLITMAKVTLIARTCLFSQNLP